MFLFWDCDLFQYINFQDLFNGSERAQFGQSSPFNPNPKIYDSHNGNPFEIVGTCSLTLFHIYAILFESRDALAHFFYHAQNWLWIQD